MRILYIITARGGSKGVPNKNIIELGGLPLLAYKAIAVKESDYLDRIILSTDSQEIAETAKRFNIEVPFIRPSELATDTASSIDVVCHAMDWVENNDPVKYDAICLLEPSSPFLSYEDVNHAMELFIEKDANAVLGVKEMEVNSLFISEIEDDLAMVKQFEKIKTLRSFNRQDMKRQYTMNGAIYIAKWDFFKKQKSFHSEKTYAYVMPSERSIEIDEMIDLYFARFLVENNLIDRNLWKESV